MSLYHKIDGWQAEVVGEKTRIDLPPAPPKKRVCTNCDDVFGEGPQTNPKKMERGFCSKCWDWYLECQRLNARRLRNRGQL